MSDDQKSGVLLIDQNNARRAFFSTAIAKNTLLNVMTVEDLNSAIALLEEIPPEALQLIVLDLDLVVGTKSSIIVQRLASHHKGMSAEIVVIADNLPREYEILIKECGIRFTLPKQVGAKQISDSIELFVKEEQKTRAIKHIVSEIQLAISANNLTKLELLLNANSQILEVLERVDDYYYLLAEIEIMRSNFGIASKLLLEFIKKGGHNPTTTLRAFSTLGKALCAQKRFDEALIVFKKISAQSPLNLRHKFLVGETELELGHYEQAQQNFSEILALDAGNTEALIGLAKGDLALGKIEDAFLRLANIRNSIESMSLASYFNNAGIALIHKGDPKEAIKFYIRSLTFFTKYKYIVLFNIGMAYLRLQKIDEAIIYFDKTIKSNRVLVKKKKILLDYTTLTKEKFKLKYTKKVTTK